MLAALKERILQTAPGTRILSYHFPLKYLEPVEVVEVDDPHKPAPAKSSLYVYVR